MPTKWTDEENDALLGLPLLARILYLQGLRRFMDYATGIVGLSRGISYQQLREVAFVEPVTGRRNAGSPTLKAVRVALSQLATAGLIESIGNEKRLIFRCLMAGRDQSGLKNEGRPRAGLGQTYQGTNFQNKFSEINHPEGRPEADPDPAYQGNPPESGIRGLRGAKAPVEPPLGAPVLGGEKGLNGGTLPVRTVFEYWRTVMGHPQAQLDTKRSRAIAARIKAGFSVEQLKQAIDGCKASPWHQGQNDRHQVYDDIELICRDAKRVEAFIARVSQKTAQQQELDDWMNDGACIEGECRHVQA